ncbi:MEDS domain-containing protein [Sinomonas atrocyanea]
MESGIPCKPGGEARKQAAAPRPGPGKASLSLPRPADEKPRDGVLCSGPVPGPTLKSAGLPPDGWEAGTRRPVSAISPVGRGDRYGSAHLVDPASQRAAFEEASAQALALGYAGLRVAADSTSLANTPARLQAWMRWECEADHLMQTKPINGLCAFDRTRISPTSMEALAAAHNRRHLRCRRTQLCLGLSARSFGDPLAEAGRRSALAGALSAATPRTCRLGCTVSFEVRPEAEGTRLPRILPGRRRWPGARPFSWTGRGRNALPR